ncbi:cell division protein FtsI (penicillin-binding protein 3) [Hydrogenivirga caldilitoris]|uniref:Cell division protein FtsI (Penicillin-binding protein 3) n=1 Tax=Hydrogenivirga caldilitoris TaxID=246264 RepID=A0A497XN96_9AQUI|nr:penicillin-binding protein 2 [Hydrogenivirga caldilitoris]RLJ70417.1 cell division protein FtsI (penicillin-binding protein 3) [Hydrogenivirga caldilitoris]
MEWRWGASRKFETKARLVLALFTILSFISLIRILDLQVTKESEIAEKIERNFDRISLIKVPLYRGSIKDANDRELALSVPTLAVYAHPDTSRLNNKDMLIEGLSKLTGIPARNIRKRIESGAKRPIKILSGIDKDLKDKLKSLIVKTKNTRYLGIQEEYTRLYPNGSIASNTIGFVGVDGKGLEGMEYLLNDYLGGGYSRALMYINGGLGKIYLHPLKGMLGEEKDVLLTLDVGVQNILEKLRDDIVRSWRPRKVSIILLDLTNGYILGLATYPYFDPNNFQSYPPDKLRNFAVTDVFEPGSIMKPFFIAWALEKGYITTNFWVNTGNGRIKVYDRYVRDPKRLGTIILRDVLVHSSNIGTIEVAKYLNKRDVEELLETFHMNKRFSIFPGEANPQLPDFNYPANILYSSIGQGIAFNTLNIAVAFGGLATGKILQPHIVKEIVSSEGKVVYRAEPEVLKDRVISEGTLRWLNRVLTKVVEDGTGHRARSRYFTIAGKTGTSQKFDFERGEYSRDKVVTYFAGFFPATDPRFVAVIVVDEPKGKKLYGGEVSAPYFKKLAEQVAFYYGLKPDKLKK